MPATRSRTVIPDGGIRAFKRRQVKASTTAATMPTDAEGNAGEISHAPDHVPVSAVSERGNGTR